MTNPLCAALARQQAAFNAQITAIEAAFPSLTAVLEAVRSAGNAVFNSARAAVGCPITTNGARLTGQATLSSTDACAALAKARGDFGTALADLAKIAAPRGFLGRFASPKRLVTDAGARAAATAHCPSGSGITAQALSPVSPTTYTVAPGDSLSSIAQRLLGDANAYPRLFAANADQVANPSLIYPGQVLRIPQ